MSTAQHHNHLLKLHCTLQNMIKAPETKILSIINKENTMQKFIMKDGNKQGKELTICCSDVQNTATHAQRNPLALTSTSVTVQIPTPAATTTTAEITLVV